MNTGDLASIKGFLGINNVADAARLQVRGGKSFLVECLNTDIDNELMLHRRDGFGDESYSAASVHSLWSSGAVCLFVQGHDLMMLNDDYSSSVIHADAGTARMSYVDVNGIIYYTNGTVIGYIQNGICYPLADPDETFKTPLEPGHLIEYFNGRLYVAQKNVIWYSDAMALGRTDKRKNFRPFPSYIAMMRAVADGLYVSDLHTTWFMGGKDPGEAILMSKANYGAIPGTDVRIDSESIAGMDPGQQVILWSSPLGICLGAPGGQFRNLTRDFYSLAGNRGAAIVRSQNGYSQYLTSIMP
jgi:hypothetical protein